MKPLGKAYEEAEARTGEFKRLPAGGYVCKITAVNDVVEGEYLEIVFDIAEGEFKGFYGDEWGQEHPYAHAIRRYYKGNAMGAFRGFIQIIDKSNGTDFDSRVKKGLHEQELVDKLIGIVVGYEEYRSTRGDVRERIYRFSETRTIEAIRSGNFTVPKLKKLGESQTENSPVPGFQQVNEADLPF